MRHQDIPVYVSSKLRHAEKLLKGLNQDGIYLTSSWLREYSSGVRPVRPVNHWLRDNFANIRRSSALVSYIETGEHLKTGLQEIGCAIENNLRIFPIMPPNIAEDNEFNINEMHPDYSEWIHLDICTICYSMEDAIRKIKMAFYPPREVLNNGGLTPAQMEMARRIEASETRTD